jgi:hypothetical protein
MPRECAFCPATANFTGEHLWSDWINKILPNRTYKYRRVDKDTLKVRSWESDELDQKANVVCGKCNSGWMSDVDAKEAKPVLRHLITATDRKVLPLRSIISLAIFGFKTAVVANHMGLRDGPFFTREQRHTFAKTLQIPGGVFMWFAALKRQTHGAFKTRYVVPQSPEHNFRLYVFTYCVGHFALQVLGSQWTADEPGRYLFPILEQDKGDNVVSTPFWPIGSETVFSWPPPEYLPEDSINAFADRWGTLKLFL